MIEDEAEWPQALDIVSSAPFTKAAFKKTFNAVSDRTS
jgi:hypothetical protein